MAPGANFASTPLVFDFKGRTMLALSSAGGKLHVASASPLAVATSADGIAPGALASWQDPNGARWILASDGQGVRAFTLEESAGALVLKPGWSSRALPNAAPPIVVNGVAFLLARGDAATPATVYALDASTGKELWSSGRTIASHVTTGTLASGSSRVLVSTADGTVHAFGFPIEH
jgi:outer membrane protein assembly factor BamB